MNQEVNNETEIDPRYIAYSLRNLCYGLCKRSGKSTRYSGYAYGNSNTYGHGYTDVFTDIHSFAYTDFDTYADSYIVSFRNGGEKQRTA